MEMDRFSNVESLITDVGADSDGEIFNNTTQQRLNDYFPFPQRYFSCFIAMRIIFQDPRYFLDAIL